MTYLAEKGNIFLIALVIHGAAEPSKTDDGLSMG